MQVKVKEAPSYVSTRNIVDEKGDYVAGCKTKEIAEKIVSLWNRKISEEISNDFFTLDYIVTHGFTPFPEQILMIHADDLRKYLKSIHDKIVELEAW